MFSGLSGAAGSIVSAKISSAASKEATETQVKALKEARDFVYNNLDPNVVNEQATQASVDQAVNRLALQGQTDPALLQQRYNSEAQISKMASQLGKGDAAAVASQATQEALGGGEVAANKQALISAALEQLNAGATLPTDVQAELVQSGLEKTGQMTGKANAQGQGGQILRKILGTAGINLQMQRQQQASALLNQAQTLETSRSSILQNLFPQLAQTQLNDLTASQNVLKQSDAMVPSAGLNAQDIASLWLGRVGQTASLTNQIGKTTAADQSAQGQIWSQATGGIAKGAATAWPTVRGWLSPNPNKTVNEP